jgi:hypothetical protein
MERCATCEWWGLHPDYDHVLSYDGAIPDDWKYCQRTIREWWGDPPPEGSLLAVSGYEFEGLATSPTFGCVQHEPKED